MARIIEVIEWPDQGPNDLLRRVPEQGSMDTQFGSQLIVRAGQMAVFFVDGLPWDVLHAGRYVLSGNSIPLLTKHLRKEEESKSFPFQTYFVATKVFADIKWGTQLYEMVGNDRTGRAFVRAYGNCSFRISDAKQFVNKLVGEMGFYSTSQIIDHLREFLRPAFQDAAKVICGKYREPILDILSNRREEIGYEMLRKAQESCGLFGITLEQMAIVTHELAENNKELLQRWGITDEVTAATKDDIDPTLIFVIMSFSNDMEAIFAGIESAASAVGLVAKRVKDVPGDYRITDQIIEMIHLARFIVADLTHERPNVYFELGYARGIGKSVVTVVREGTNVHFDVKDWTYISYTDSRFLERDLRTRFEFEVSKGS